MERVEPKILCIIGCTKSKNIIKDTAQNVYSKSPLFRECLSITKKLNADVLILSSKYGLISLDTLIEPYTDTWKEYKRMSRDMSKEERREIDKRNKESIVNIAPLVQNNSEKLKGYDRVIILAPARNSKNIFKTAKIDVSQFEFWFEGALGSLDMTNHLKRVFNYGLEYAKDYSQQIRKQWKKPRRNKHGRQSR